MGLTKKNTPSSSSKKSVDSTNGDTSGENSKTSENSAINGNGKIGNSNNGNGTAGNDESENMECDDADGPSSVRTITPTSTAELTEERMAKKSSSDVIK